MGKNNDIIINEKDIKTDKKETGTTIHLSNYKKRFPDKKIEIIARRLTEKLLPYFISEEFTCPEIKICEKDGSNPIILNDFINNELSGYIQEFNIDQKIFSKTDTQKETFDFSVKVFKFFSPQTDKSKITLVADKREVTKTALDKYIPEFIDEFYEQSDDNQSSKNYIIKAYVFGKYLDMHVDIEREGFAFKKENNLLYGISQNEIEYDAAIIAQSAVGTEITARKEKKRKDVTDYVENEAPWHKGMLENIDLADLPFNPKPEAIEPCLHHAKYQQEVSIKREVEVLLNGKNVNENISEIVNKISETSKNDLTHYVALRRYVLSILDKNLGTQKDGKYSSEETIHNIIFPMRSDSENTEYKDHNLWILDERLNFAKYVSSDKPLNGGTSERPDIISYDKRIMFRGDNKPSNPVTIFEFKKPHRDDFANPSSTENPIKQIVRYVNSIKVDEFKTLKGRKIAIADNTPFYGYVVCSINDKIERWLNTEEDFTSMPDKLGWYAWKKNINLYIEVLDWEKILKDATIRNEIFFKKLSI